VVKPQGLNYPGLEQALGSRRGLVFKSGVASWVTNSFGVSLDTPEARMTCPETVVARGVATQQKKGEGGNATEVELSWQSTKMRQPERDKGLLGPVEVQSIMDDTAMAEDGFSIPCWVRHMIQIPGGGT
jgi:hypothetical protein